MQVSSCWDESLSLADSLDVLSELALSHAREGGVVGSSIADLVNGKKWSEIVNYELDLSADWDVLQLFHCRSALGFFQKLEDLEIGVDKELVALNKFRESEVTCSSLNTFFRALARGSVYCRSRDARLIEAVRRKIRQVLGRCPEISELNMGFGPGATTSIKRAQSCPQTKMARGMACSTTLISSGRLPELLREVPHWAGAMATGYSIDEEGWLIEHVPVKVTDGKLAFVPKNAKTYRSIMVEPVLNGFLQMGIGRYIAQRLRMRGIDVDIRDQKRNADLAKFGSITGELATLDLRSASDSISTELVRYLLGDEWFDLLNAARTPTYTYKGKVARLEKFCSMGNGFTFPLETLLFYAITTATCAPGSVIGVYGDDIICPTESVQDVMYALKFFGFEVNAEKSFFKGPFRESCGKDFYLGHLVRPYYQKHLVSGQTLFTLHNFYVNVGLGEWAARVLAYIPRPLRIYGPPGYGDGHLVSEVYPRRISPKLLQKGYCGHTFETYSAVSRKIINIYPGDYISPLYHVYVSDANSSLSEARRKTVYWSYREYIEDLRFTRELQFDRTGRPYWTIPGKSGYKKSKIYTLAV